MLADPLPVTRERIEAALDKIAAYVAEGIVTAEGIAPVWDRLERMLASEPLHDRILARHRTATASMTSASRSSDAPAP